MTAEINKAVERLTIFATDQDTPGPIFRALQALLSELSHLREENATLGADLKAACADRDDEEQRAINSEQKVATLTRERDEAREICRVMTEFYPFGQRLSRDEMLRDALLAVPSPSDRQSKEGGE